MLNSFLLCMVALTALRNQLGVKPDEKIAPQDERLLLTQQWMEIAPKAQDMFEVWEGSNQVCNPFDYDIHH